MRDEMVIGCAKIGNNYLHIKIENRGAIYYYM